jgi:hypothetical protein
MNILPKPRLYLDEFRQQATINFDNAEEDRLDLVLPLQLVSCPNNEAGQGGIVVRRDTFLEAGDHFDNIRLFKKGVLDQIPSGFRDVNPDYIYRIVSPVNEKSVAKLQKKVREVNMMTDPGTSVKIHLPLIHEKSVYRFRQPLSSDVVAYQLTALICQPHLRRQDIKPIEQSILKARKRMEKLSLDLNMTPVAEVKIAEAFARMRMVQNDAIYRFLGAAARLVDEQLKIVEELYEDRWAHQMEEYGSLLSLFDGVELKDVTVGKSKKLLNLSRFDASLSRRDLSAYVAIRKIMDESGVQYVNRQDLKKSLGVDDISLRESLDMLRNRGYIIMLENGSLIKVFDLGEFSGRFDEALPK